MRTPALYTAPYEYGHTHPDPDEVLRAAGRLTDLAENERGVFHDETNTARILHGLADRTDLTDAHVDGITALESCDRTVLAALIANPALDASTIAGLFSHETLPYFLARTDVVDFADQIIRGCPDSRRVLTGPEHYALVRSRLGQPAIDDYFTRALAVPNASALRVHAQHPLLTPGGFDRIIEVAEDPATKTSLAQDIVSHLTHREDMTDGQGLRLVEAIAVLSRLAVGTGRWLLSDLIMNRSVPTAVMTKMISHRAQWARDLVLTMDHVRPETLFAAVRSHQPHAVMRLPIGTVLPADVAHAVLADLETGTVRRRALPAEEIQRFVCKVLQHSDAPEVWERALPLFVASRTEPDQGVARYGFSFSNVLTQPTIVRVATPSSQTRTELAFTWMSSNPDPNLRIAALASLYLREQVELATCDESEEVRAAVLFHALVDAEMLAGLVGDPSPMVRAVIATHPAAGEDILLTLNADPDPSVRAAVAERCLIALTGTG